MDGQDGSNWYGSNVDSSSTFLDSYCKPVSPFWDGVSGSKFSGDEVDFPLCFQDTVFLSVPCFIFIVGGLLNMYILRRKQFIIPTTFWNASKFVFIGILILLNIINLIHISYLKMFFNTNSVATYQIVSPSIVILSLLMALALVLYHMRKGIYTSGFFHVFWFVLIIHGIVKTRTYSFIVQSPLDLNEASSDIFFLVLTICQLLIAIVLLIITFFPDKIAPEWFEGIAKPSPEERATFLSQITYWWMNGMIWHGYRRALERTDLWSLYRYDISSLCIQKFSKNWEEEVAAKKISYYPQPSTANIDDDEVLLRTMKTGENAPLLNTQSISRQQGLSSSSSSSSSSKPKKRKSVQVFYILVRTYWFPFLISALLKLVNEILIFVSPQILNLIIHFVSNRSEPVWHGVLYAFLLLINSIVQSLFYEQHFLVIFRLAMNVRSAIIGMIYKKSLKLTNSARQQSTVGEIVNLMSVDTQRLMDVTTFISYLWTSPLDIVLAVASLYLAIGYSVFPGLFVMFVLIIPLNGVISYVNRQIQKKQMKVKDERIKCMNEILNSMKVLKLYSWENSFRDQIIKIRNKELYYLKVSVLISSISMVTWMSAPFLVALSSFATFVLTGHDLTPAKTFVALSLFNILRVPLIALPSVISFTVESSVSVTRLNKFLNLEELREESIDWAPTPAVIGEPSISISNGNFAWEVDSRVILRNLNVVFRPKWLVAIVGQVGAGKSSFISALLGDMEKRSGNVKIRGTIAYSSQLAWIQNKTLKDNITFGKDFSELAYRDVVRACALEQDIKMLPAGDATEIGERGINLSGGQKQRISLARAVYQDHDIYLLDDPLSAVDAHVGQHIFQELISEKGLLKNKTRILVTHGLAYTPQCDYIILLHEGVIAEKGSYRELTDLKGEFYRLYQAFQNAPDDDNDDGVESEDEIDLNAPNTTIQSEITPFKKQISYKRMISFKKQKSVAQLKEEKEEKKDKMITEEEVEKSTVKFNVLWNYLKAIGLGVILLVMIIYIMFGISQGGSSIWLAYWSEAYNNLSSNATVNVGLYLGIYSAFGAAQLFFNFCYSIILPFGAIVASRNIHNKLLTCILRTPMSFFDTTPLGRILNRFSKDIYFIDENIPRSILSFLSSFFQIIITILIICYSTPIFIAVIIPLAIFYFVLQRIYVATSRQLSRIESASRSPIYSHFQETLTGVSVIRSFRRQNEFREHSAALVDTNMSAYYPSMAANRWLGIRLTFIGHGVVFFSAIFSVVSRQLNITSAGLVGLAISYALSMTQALNWLVRMISTLETSFVSVERVKEYSEVPSEAAPIVDNLRPAKNWPDNGVVSFENYFVRYRPELDNVLKGITMVIPGGQKCAICGRTGSGKSTLTLSLFRILEASQGRIVIDGLDISQMGLEDLRSKLTIIPQDPVLFSGTLRMNADPSGLHSDDEIWEAFERSHLKEQINATMPNGLDHEIQEAGENISVGQRQMVCLARALLRKSKILILDEATAAVDMETDGFIQKTIREDFKESTVITIAHRLHTIMDYDWVVVLEQGEIVESDTPDNLIHTRGIFYNMAKDAEIVS